GLDMAPAAERPICGRPGRVEREAEYEPEAEGEHGDVLAEIAHEARDPDVVSPAADVIAEPVRTGRRGQQHPPGRDEHRDEADQEDVDGQAGPAPLRPAAQDL